MQNTEIFYKAFEISMAVLTKIEDLNETFHKQTILWLNTINYFNNIKTNSILILINRL